MVTHPAHSHGNSDSWRVVVLNWNTADLALECIESINSSAACCGGLTLDRVVVDNGSDSFQRQQLQQGIAKHPEWQLLLSDTNRGFAAGMNLGLDLDSLPDCQRVLFVNSDIVVDAAFFSALRDHIHAHGGEVITGVQIRRADDDFLETMGGYRYYSWLGATKRASTVDDPIDYISGAIFLCDRELLNKTRGLPEQNFLYFEELNLAAQLPRNQGMGACESAVAWHQGGASTSQLQNNPTRHYHAALACFRYTAKTPIRLPSVVLTRLAYLVLVSLKGGSSIAAKDGLKALLAFVKEYKLKKL